MNCSIVNARPQNISIDANGSYDNMAFKFTFYGDRTIGADFFIYDMNTNKLWNNMVYKDYAAANNKKYYYNGEEIDVHVETNSSNNNKQFVWKTRVYDDVDITKGKNPTVRVVTGTVKANPYIKGKIPVDSNNKDVVEERYIYIEPTKEISLPSWIYIGDEKRAILEYKYIDETSPTQLKLKSAFTTYPSLNEEYTISPYKTATVSTLETNQLPIATGINIDGDATDNRRGFNITVDYPTTPQPCYYLEIGDTFYAITGYSARTGIVTLDTTEDVKNTIAKGTSYTIYSSFVESPFFYFTTEPTPVIEKLQLVQDGEIIRCTADLVAKSFVKYQYWEIYDATATNTPTLVETSEKMYLGALEFIFRGGLVGHSYKAVLHTVTQTNWDITKESDVLELTTSLSGNNVSKFQAVITDDNSIQLNITISNTINKNGGVKILRKSSNSNSSLTSYVATIDFNDNKASGSIITFKDYKTANNTKYKYYICCYNPTTSSNKNTMYTAYESKWIDTDYKTYSIYALQEVTYERYDVDTDKRIDYDYMYSERAFKLIKIFRPELNVTEKHNINHNLGRDVYVGYAKKPVVSARETTYDTFSLSFQLGNTQLIPCNGVSYDDAVKYNMGYISIINNTIRYYQTLKQIIANAPPFLIKDYKGNMWFGSITTHNTEIDNATLNERPITVNLDFTETYPIEKIRIVGE